MTNLSNIPLSAWIGIGAIVIATAVLLFAAAMFRWQRREADKRTAHIQSRINQAVIDQIEHDLYVHTLRAGGVDEVGRAMGEALVEAVSGKPVERVDLPAAIARFE